MSKKSTMTLDAFKYLLEKDKSLKATITSDTDIIDLDNGVMRVHMKNIDKYLEKYACKDVRDLSDTLWYGYGIFCQVIE